MYFFDEAPLSEKSLNCDEGVALSGRGQLLNVTSLSIKS